MSTTTQSAEKRTAVEALTFDTRTAKRVAWSQWEFRITAPYTVEVTNASYGHLKREHTYEVMIDEDGIPVSCTCPGFKHHYQPTGKVGKHMLVLATVAGPTVLNAAVAFEKPAPDTDEVTNVTTGADLLAERAGVLADAKPEESDECKECMSLSDFPCWECYRTSRCDLPE